MADISCWDDRPPPSTTALARCVVHNHLRPYAQAPLNRVGLHSSRHGSFTVTHLKTTTRPSPAGSGGTSILTFYLSKSNNAKVYKYQWWNVTKYIHSSTVLKSYFKVLVFEYFYFLLLYTSTPLHF